MGIFDKLKQVGRYITGNSADLNIRIDEGKLDTESRLSVMVFCNVKDTDLLVDRLYIRIRAIETTRVKVHGNYNSKTHHRKTQTRTQTATTYKHEVNLDENFRLDALGEYEWQGEIMLPHDRQGTYRGINATHEWQVSAGLAVKGTNPSSAWVDFYVR